MAAVTNASSFVERQNFLRGFLGRYELEVYAFKVGWYNDYIDMIKKDYYKPDYPKDTVGFIILDTPYFFDKVLKPFVRKRVQEHGAECLQTLEPFEDCMKYLVSEIQQGLAGTSMEYFSANKKVNGADKYFGVQAAGDVAGGARYYRREDVVPDHWPQDKQIFGVSIHPRYGGYFAFRGALIFPGLTYPGLLRVDPEDVVPTRDLRIQLLESANCNDRSWQDAIHVDKKYSEEQRRFCDIYATREQKIAMMREWVNEGRY